MKYRKDFVTNSSSSSYVCDICGRVESGYELGLPDAEMYVCVNGHTFCEDESVKIDKIELIRTILEDEYNENSEDELQDMNIEELHDLIYEDRYGVSEKLCPICQLKNVPEDSLVKYLLVKYNLNKEDVIKEISTQFGTYEKFEEYINTK